MTMHCSSGAGGWSDGVRSSEHIDADSIGTGRRAGCGGSITESVAGEDDEEEDDDDSTTETSSAVCEHGIECSLKYAIKSLNVWELTPRIVHEKLLRCEVKTTWMMPSDVCQVTPRMRESSTCSVAFRSGVSMAIRLSVRTRKNSPCRWMEGPLR